MLTEERQKKILELVESHGSVTATELSKNLDASESTIRRDLNALDEAGLLTKVHGGAIANESHSYSTADDDVTLRKEKNIAEKQKIAKYAASLIEDKDFVYLDAGTTTDLMIDYIDCKETIFVTNAIYHAKRLTARGFTTYLLGGEFKSITEAIVGEEAIASVEKYNFTKGFFGANGMTEYGFTTPELKEAMIKKKAIASSKEAYILLDSSKFDQVAAITFATIGEAAVITDQIPKKYASYPTMREVK